MALLTTDLERRTTAAPRTLRPRTSAPAAAGRRVRPPRDGAAACGHEARRHGVRMRRHEHAPVANSGS
jgi:hypothetical protein